MNRYLLCFTFLCVSVCGCSGDATDPAAAKLRPVVEKLRPVHTKIQPPGPSDWLANHKEPGQSFGEYLRCRPVVPQGKRKVLYIQPVGDFTASQQRVVKLTAEYMRLCFGIEVRFRESVPLSVIPEKSQRVHPSWGVKQVHAGYILDNVLKPRLPADAAAMLGFTASDLWPGKNWNFVFGLASLRERVGVWSVNRNGDPDENQEAFRLCLRRTIKTAVHETGHMFSMLHCTAYECCMCGSNHREESDRRPLYLCPECVAKLCWATGQDPVERYRKLAGFCKKSGLEEECAFFKRSQGVLDLKK